jgi:hypothetical protein
MRLPLTIAAVLLAAPASAQDTPDAPSILDRAIAAAGGEGWANARTLMLAGSAVFYGPTGASPRSTADDYRMWRVYDPARTASHAAEGKVRIIAKSGARTLFTVGYDGVTTWNDKGVVPKAEADAYWASNFGFGIIRRAREEGFKAERVPDDAVAGRALYMVRLTDPQGGVTLFGIDQQSHAIRTMGFATPRGWHLRVYDDFLRLKNPDWLQARKVTLYYNGVKQNEVTWRETRVNAPIDDAIFAAPAG